MINWFIDNGVGVSVGIISDTFNGADSIVYDALKRCVAQGMDKCAIWNHGQDAAFRYGEATSLEEVQQRVQACDTKIKTYFPGYEPFLMAPHQNSWGPFLLQALRNLNYKVVSASAGAYSGMTWDLTLNPMQMPQQATTGDWSNDVSNFVGVPVSKTVADCEAAAARGEVCVIMTHPHEFANGAYNLTTLARLVQSLKSAGFTSTNFYTVMNEQLGVISREPTVAPTNEPSLVPTVAATAVPSLSMVPTSHIVSTDGRCGVDFGNTFCGDEAVPCCSEYGWCGTGATFCGLGCQSAYGLCDGMTYSPSNQPIGTPTLVPTNEPTNEPTAVPTIAATAVPSLSMAPTSHIVSTDGRCGIDFGNTFCGDEAVPCCSEYGWCGTGATFCGLGCQSAYGLCDGMTYSPSNQPIGTPTLVPTNEPTNEPTAVPTIEATAVPTIAATAIPSLSMAPTSHIVSTDGRCGIDFGNTFCGDEAVPCCSEYGWCGTGTTFCGLGCQSVYGLCDGLTYSPSNQPIGTPTLVPTNEPTNEPTAVPTVAATAVPSISMAPTSHIISTDGRCGVDFGNTFCGDEAVPCCSEYGWCGTGETFCGVGCQTAYGLCDGMTYSPSNQPIATPTLVPTNEPTNEPTVAPSAVPTNQPVAELTLVPTNEPTVALSAVPTNQPVAELTLVPTNEPTVALSAVPTNQPVAELTLVPTNEPTVALSAAPTNQPVAELTLVPTNAPTVTLSAVPTNKPVAELTLVPTNAPTVTSSAVPTNSPSKSLRTACPSQSPTKGITQLQYTANIRVKSAKSNKYQWLNVLETVRKVEKSQNLIDVQYAGNTEVSSSEFDISIKMTFGLNPDSNPQLVFYTTAVLLSGSIYFDNFEKYYHSLGADKKTKFTRVSYQGDASLNYEVNENDIKNDSNSSNHGLFSFQMNAANISILAGICFFSLLCFVVIGYFVYQRCYNNSDYKRKRVNSISTTGSNEEMLSPSERFVELELNSHYSLPKSDNSDFVEDACILRHGLKLPDELENV
jgi:hypothetical protein